MLRRTFLASAALLAGAAVLPAAAFAADDDEDYITLEKPLPGGAGKIVKIWAYDCPFCFRYDTGVDPKAMPLAEKETGLKFDMYHLETRGKYGRTATELFAWCRLQDEAAGRSMEDETSLFRKSKDAVYKAYHRQGYRWPEGEEAFLETALKPVGLTAEAFAAARVTPEVQALADLWKSSLETARLQGIPAYVVNGRYLILTKRIRSVRGFVDLVAELSKKPL
ncbi:thiol:disulfide interchange protein [Sutterella sp.]|uniref:thiol:disulfide interchange protein n=1 Tax=Sutterella sp. TaxID=1981025 RepID=UPI0026DF227B|nr:thiol:disulfide interchange protein [Sutterella sp.]MDO5532038.1 thiol:disulfide interchange protein [Sutterella sp.]